MIFGSDNSVWGLSVIIIDICLQAGAAWQAMVDTFNRSRWESLALLLDLYSLLRAPQQHSSASGVDMVDLPRDLADSLFQTCVGALVSTFS